MTKKKKLSVAQFWLDVLLNDGNVIHGCFICPLNTKFTNTRGCNDDIPCEPKKDRKAMLKMAKEYFKDVNKNIDWDKEVERKSKCYFYDKDIKDGAYGKVTQHDPEKKYPYGFGQNENGINVFMNCIVLDEIKYSPKTLDKVDASKNKIKQVKKESKMIKEINYVECPNCKCSTQINLSKDLDGIHNVICDNMNCEMTIFYVVKNHKVIKTSNNPEDVNLKSVKKERKMVSTTIVCHNCKKLHTINLSTELDGKHQLACECSKTVYYVIKAKRIRMVTNNPDKVARLKGFPNDKVEELFKCPHCNKEHAFAFDKSNNGTFHIDCSCGKMMYIGIERGIIVKVSNSSFDFEEIDWNAVAKDKVVCYFWNDDSCDDIEPKPDKPVVGRLVKYIPNPNNDNDYGPFYDGENYYYQCEIVKELCNKVYTLKKDSYRPFESYKEFIDAGFQLGYVIKAKSDERYQLLDSIRFNKDNIGTTTLQLFTNYELVTPINGSKVIGVRK